ncbi:ATP-binding protein [Streptomyces nitrosporeus]|uniref:ATP-binding protein n=1 Tax=Streptomyces nitrosporeus TaxID=28894 RepID=UPI0039A164D9
MESSRLEALYSVLAALGADPDSVAWHELARLVATAARPEEALTRLGAVSATDPAQAPADRWLLARALDRLAAEETGVEQALTGWIRRHAPSDTGATGATGAVGTTGSTGNVMSGGSVVHGPSVQARDIRGGIHFHTRAEAPRSRPPVPRQLPAVTNRLLGRDGDRRALDEIWAGPSAPASRIMVVTGLAGVGKTTLVSHWLREHTSSFPDGHLYADLAGHAAGTENGPSSPGAVLEAFLVSLGVPSVPADTAQRIALWRSLTAELRIAVLLDNAFSAAQVRPLLLGAPAALTVVTSRNSLSGLRADGASVHRLDGLPAESAVELLAVGGGARVAREPTAAHEVVRLCGGLPLAVGLASAQLAVRPYRSVSALADSLAHGQGAAGALYADGEAVLRTALDLSYRSLPGRGAELYRLMGVLPTDRYDPFMLAAALRGRSPDAAQLTDMTMQTLMEANLLDETGPGTYRLHDVVRPHARRLGQDAEGHEWHDRVLRRYVDWCLATTAAAERILVPSHRLPGQEDPEAVITPTPLNGPGEALAWLDTQRNGIMGAIRHCARAGWHTSCWRLADSAWPLFQRLRPTDLWIEAHRLGLEAARLSGSGPGEGRMLTSGAIGLRNAGRYEEAASWYRRALEMAEADGDTRQEAQAISGLGHLHLLTARLDEAQEYFEHALRLRESGGHRRGAALTRRRLGETARAKGDLASAARYLRQAEAELGALEETYEQTRVRALLGHVLEQAGTGAEGVALLEEALAVFRSDRARSEDWEGRCLEWLGVAAGSRGDTSAAENHYRAAHALLRRLDPEAAQRVAGRLRQL